MYRELPNPFATVIRALADELNIRWPTIRDLRCLGICTDLQRAQPLFVFFLRSNELSLKDVLQCFEGGPLCKHENTHVLGLEWTLDNIANFLAGMPLAQLRYEAFPQTSQCIDEYGHKLGVSSNHAVAAYLLALSHTYGTETVHDAILKRAPWQRS